MATVEANIGAGRTRPSPDWLRAFVASQSKGARSLASSVRREDRLRFSRTVTFHVIAAYWQEHQSESSRRWPLRDLPGESDISPLEAPTEPLAQAIGSAAAKLDVPDASYLIGSLYTGMMPERVRAQLGAYYTPPALCERLLDMATDAGVDWRTATVLDPACGGGAFLAPVARRMAASMEKCSAIAALHQIQQRLRGFELDAFAGWMSQVFVAVTPTSFLAGEYFKALRSLLGWEAPPVSVDFVGTRKGVFADVLQETLLAVYRRGDYGGKARVHLISPGSNGSIQTTAAGSFRLPESLDQPWLIPRTKSQFKLVRRAERFPCRLADYGYSVSTGPLVWNRHKTSLTRWSGRNRYVRTAPSSSAPGSETISLISSPAPRNTGW